MAWCHRIAGLILVAYLWVHIYRLFSLSSPSLYHATMKAYYLFHPAILGLALAIPLIFHTLNGGRLILYESFGKRNDETMIRWVLFLSFLYLGLLGVMILMGNQSISPFLFWFVSITIAFILGYGVTLRVQNRQHSFYWKLQRMTGGFLLVMVPAYFLFMHLNPFPGMEADRVIFWMEGGFIRAVRLLLLMAGLYHGGYGLFSVASDYLSSRILRIGFAFLVTLVMLIFAWLCFKLTLGI
jgi:succinate dehydrogenase hydrophobic anchor subunit